MFCVIIMPMVEKKTSFIVTSVFLICYSTIIERAIFQKITKNWKNFTSQKLAEDENKEQKMEFFDKSLFKNLN